MRTRVLAAALAVVACAVTAGCSSSGKSSKATTTTTKNYTISTAEGQVSVSLDGQLPDGWPQGFPLPSGAKAAGSGSLVGKTEGVMVGVFTLSGSAQDAYDFYRNNRELTVESASSVGGNKAFVGTVKLSGTYSGLVTIGTVGTANGLVVVLDAGGTTSSSGASTGASSA